MLESLIGRAEARSGRVAPADDDLNVGRFLLFVAGYLLSIKASEHLYGSLAVPSPFWFPDSVLLCALLLVRGDRWWVLIISTWPLRLVAGAPTGTPLWFLLASIANDSVKATAGAWLLQRVLGRKIQLKTLSEFLVFVGLAAVVVPVFSALAAMPWRQALGDSPWTAGYRWFLGDSLAQVVVTPTLLYWFTARHRPVRVRWTELLLLCSGLAVVSWYAFVVPHETQMPSLLYAPVPFLLWAAVRFRPLGTANAVS